RVVKGAVDCLEHVGQVVDADRSQGGRLFLGREQRAAALVADQVAEDAYGPVVFRPERRLHFGREIAEGHWFASDASVTERERGHGTRVHGTTTRSLCAPLSFVVALLSL